MWIALLGVIPLALFVQWSDMRVGGTMAAGPFPPLAACLQWGALLWLNALFTRRNPSAPRRGLKIPVWRAFGQPSSRTRNASFQGEQDVSGRGEQGEESLAARGLLTSGELLVVLAVWLAANMVVGRGLLHPLLASLAGPTYYARSGAMQIAAAQNLPSWLAITDKSAARQFYEGYAVPVPWALWARPLGAWALFLLPFLTANLCLCALFERAWVRNERLAFPLVALPLEAVQEHPARPGGAPFRRAVAFGLAVPFLLHGFGVAHA
ncbi:MAG TPA: DUF6785 family protein, partial [Chthonomonadaceae bacterium]|nr:DUF6785 family protein [Chthonomonadaceae bacterium]